LSYIDPTGESVIGTIIVVGIIATRATMNVVRNWDHISTSSNPWLTGLGYAGIGAGEAAARLWLPGGVIWGPAVADGLNATMRKRFEDIGEIVFTSLISNAIGAGVGKGVGKGVGELMKDVDNKLVKNIVTSVSKNIVGDFASNMSNAIISNIPNYGSAPYEGNLLRDAWKSSFTARNLLFSTVTGTLEGLHKFNQDRRANTPPPSNPLDLNKTRPDLYFSTPTPTFPLSQMPTFTPTMTTPPIFIGPRVFLPGL